MELNLFELVSLHWISVALGALLLAYLGWFYPFLILLWVLVDISGSIYFVKKGYLQIKKHSTTGIWVLVALTILALGLSLFTTPTIFGGRDEGSFATAAIQLSRDHSLRHQATLTENFFPLYDYGKALNFPGFFYLENGKIISQFLPGYSAWTAIFFSFGKLTGLKFVNLLPWITFLFSFYLVLRSFTKNSKHSLWGLAILVTSLPFIVFYKFTLTEIFFGSLLWLALHFLLRYQKEKTIPNFLLIIFPLLMIPFVRIEAVAIVFVLLLILIITDHQHLKLARYQMVFALLGLCFAFSVITNSHFFVEALKGFSQGTVIENATEGKVPLLPDDWQSFYSLKIFFNYNLLPMLFLGAVMTILLLRQKKWASLLPLFLFAPTLVYLVDANISLDHPWYLRRLVFTVIPLSILYGTLLLQTLEKKHQKFCLFVITIILFTNVILSVPFLVPSQNQKLLSQVEHLTQSLKLNKKDLLLISQNASGSGWSLMAEPMRTQLGLQAVYFFRPSDFHHLNRDEFGEIYLITANEDEALYQELPKDLVREYHLQNNIISPSRNPLEKPRFEEYTVQGKVYQLQGDGL